MQNKQNPCMLMTWLVTLGKVQPFAEIWQPCKQNFLRKSLVKWRSIWALATVWETLWWCLQWTGVTCKSKSVWQPCSIFCPRCMPWCKSCQKRSSKLCQSSLQPERETRIGNTREVRNCFFFNPRSQLDSTVVTYYPMQLENGWDR